MTVPSLRSSRRRRACLALAVGALLLTGVSACGSSDDTTREPGALSDTTAPSPESTGSADAGSTMAVTAVPPAAATASDTSPADGIAPASISIDSPDSGTSVSTTLTVSGTANSPEANVPWQIDSPIDGVLVSGFATAKGWLDKAYPWSTSVDIGALQPGTYTFTARVDDDSKHEGTAPPTATITFVKK